MPENWSRFSYWVKWLLILLVLGVTAVYSSVVHFGFIWDDPLWYERLAQKNWLTVWLPFTDFQFYRPVTMAYHRFFLQPNGGFDAFSLHWGQICWHVLNTALVYRLSRRVGFQRVPAFLVTLLVALYPFSHQAIVWAVPHQPMAMAFQLGAWLTFLQAYQRGVHVPEKKWLWLSYGLFVIALFVQESTVALAVMPFLLDWYRRGQNGRFWHTPLVAWRKGELFFYPIAAVSFVVLWLVLPLQREGLTGLFLDRSVWVYLAQGFVYPLLGKPSGYTMPEIWSEARIVWLFLAIMVVLGGTAVYRQRFQLFLVAFSWAVLGLATALVGLDYSYVSLAPRFLYLSAPGIAWMWVAALWPSDNQRKGFRWQAITAVLLTLLISWQSIQLIVSFQHLYAVGTSHLAEMVEAIGQTEGRYLFLNFPDRYAPKKPPYPLGYWGVTLAPVVVDLGQFPGVLTGHRPQTVSWSVPAIDADVRDTSPYQVDMRGVILPPGHLYFMSDGYEKVFVTRYLPDGRFHLVSSGWLERPAKAASKCNLVQFDNGLCLQQVELERKGKMLTVRLAWTTNLPQSPHITPFVHVGVPGHPPVVQADGDPWQGAMPLANLQIGDMLHDWREITLPSLPEGSAVQVGVYNWVTGEREVAILVADGQPLPGNRFSVPLPSE